MKNLLTLIGILFLFSCNYKVKVLINKPKININDFEKINFKMIDYDGNEYNTIFLEFNNFSGGIFWTTENLKVKHYNNGDEIINCSEKRDNPSCSIGLPNLNSIDRDTSFYNYEGAFMSDAYNWYAIDDERGVCPEGWRPLKYYEWEELIDDLNFNLIDLNTNHTFWSFPEIDEFNSPVYTLKYKNDEDHKELYYKFKSEDNNAFPFWAYDLDPYTNYRNKRDKLNFHFIRCVSDLVYYGCTNPNSYNFDPKANLDDGTCIQL